MDNRDNGTLPEHKVSGHYYVNQYDQTQAGVNASDSAYTAGMKVDAYRNAQNQGPIDFGSGGAAGGSSGFNLIDMLMIFVWLGLFYALFVTSVNLKNTGYYFLHYGLGNGPSISEQIISKPAIENTLNTKTLRNKFEYDVGQYVNNKVALKNIWATCDSNCVKPATTDVLKLIKFVPQNHQLEFLRAACFYPGSFGEQIADMNATPEGCYIKNYERLKGLAKTRLNESLNSLREQFAIRLLEFLATIFAIGFFARRAWRKMKEQY